MDTMSLERQSQLLQQIAETQKQILAALGQIGSQTWYSPAEFARAVKRKPSTIRLWCRRGRIEARKRPLGRGDKLEWEIPAEELQRYRNHGLLPEHPDVRQFTAVDR